MFRLAPLSFQECQAGCRTRHLNGGKWKTVVFLAEIYACSLFPMKNEERIPLYVSGTIQGFWYRSDWSCCKVRCKEPAPSVQGLDDADGQQWDSSLSVPQAGIQNPRVEKHSATQKPLCFILPGISKILYHNSLVLVLITTWGSKRELHRVIFISS